MQELNKIFDENFLKMMPGVRVKEITLESFKKGFPTLSKVIEKSMKEAYSLGAKNATDFITKKL